MFSVMKSPVLKKTDLDNIKPHFGDMVYVEDDCRLYYYDGSNWMIIAVVFETKCQNDENYIGL